MIAVCVHATQKISSVFLDCHRNSQRANKRKKGGSKSKGRGSKAKDDTVAVTDEIPIKEQLEVGFRYEPMTLAQHEDADFEDKLFFWNETNNTMRLCIIQENKAMGSVLIRLQPPEEAAAADASPSKKRRGSRLKKVPLITWSGKNCNAT